MIADALAIARFHILLIAAVAQVTFGWLMTGRYRPGLAVVVGLDWFLINLFNKITDIEEDRKNDIRGTERVARKKGALTVFAFALLIGSIIVGHLVAPSLTPWRLAVQAIGLAYSYRLVPAPHGLRRMKEIYFLKNFMSAVLFVLTCFVYPIAIEPSARVMSWPAIASLALFFIPFELTYEILYDLRDLDGDRAAGIPTYPVVHGPETARRIIDGLLIFSSAILIAAIALGHIGVREGLMLAAPVTQLLFYRPRYRRGLTSHDCILLTHLGTAQLLLYLAGTALWLRLGLPENYFLRIG
jgi:4-hydroxybenzoate polyprenyltransferase